jgi:hypothetical protein
MCRYFRLGKCTRGESCPYSHDLSHPDSFICPYFLEGFCKYGSRCQYDHKYPEVGHLVEQPVQSSCQAVKPEPCRSEVFSVDSQPWRQAGSNKVGKPSVDVLVLSTRRAVGNLSSAAAPFSASKASDSQNWRRSASVDDNSRPLCVYFQTGACQFGDKCRFKHITADQSHETAAAIATAQHATRTAAHLRNLETMPPSEERVQALSSRNQPASGMVQVAPVKKKSAWSNSLLADRNSAGLPQTLPEPSRPQSDGWRVVDSNVDLLDPWERSQNPSTIPHRAIVEDSNTATEDFAAGYDELEAGQDEPDPSEMLCTEYTWTGQCSVQDTCQCIHGDACPCCGYFCLHPTDEDMRRAHETACFAMYEEAERLQAMQTVCVLLGTLSLIVSMLVSMLSVLVITRSLHRNCIMSRPFARLCSLLSVTARTLSFAMH